MTPQDIRRKIKARTLGITAESIARECTYIDQKGKNTFFSYYGYILGYTQRNELGDVVLLAYQKLNPQANAKKKEKV